MTVPEYVNGVAIDPGVYTSWPSILPPTSWVAYFTGSSSEPASFLLLEDGGESQTVAEVSVLPDGTCIAKLTLGFIPDTDEVLAGGIWVAPDYRRSGVATFMGVTARTWMAETYGKKFIVDRAWADPIGLLVVEKIKETYQVPGEEVYKNSPSSSGGQ